MGSPPRSLCFFLYVDRQVIFMQFWLYTLLSEAVGLYRGHISHGWRD